MLFVLDGSVGILYKKKFDIASGFGNSDRFFFLALSLLAGVRQAYECRCFNEGKASMQVSLKR